MGVGAKKIAASGVEEAQVGSVKLCLEAELGAILINLILIDYSTLVGTPSSRVLYLHMQAKLMYFGILDRIKNGDSCNFIYISRNLNFIEGNLAIVATYRLPPHTFLDPVEAKYYVSFFIGITHE